MADEPVAAGAAVDVRRLHPLTPFFDLVLMARQFALPIVVAVLANRDRGQLLVLVPTLLAALIGAAKWWRFTYAFDGRRLVIAEGLFTRKERIVPLDRIQQVDLESKLRHRLLGVTVLKIDTAGGGPGGAEVDLSVVSTGEAGRLRALLLRGAEQAPAATPTTTPTTTPTDQAAPPETELLRLGVGRLALAGMTGAELAVMLTILVWVGQFLDDLPDSFLEDRLSELTAPQSPAGFSLAGAMVLVAWFGLAAAASVLKNGQYRLVARGTDLAVSRGLLDQRQAMVPLHRVQTARLQESFVRRLLRMTNVRFRSTAGAIDVPLATSMEVEHLLESVLPGDRPDRLVPAPPAARRRAILRRLVPAVVVAAAGTAWQPRILPLAIAVVVASAAAGELAYRGLGHGWRGGFVVMRSGGLRRETFIVPSGKAQSTRLRTSPFQRRAGLATLFVDVAGRGAMPAIRDGDLRRLVVLQSELVSEPARQDEATLRRRAPTGGSDS